jgi:antitoxin component of MazEF toxin-antitoxin module
LIQSVQAVRKWGNSRAVVITRRVQRQLTWNLREVVHVSVVDDAIVLRPVRVTVGGASASSGRTAGASG